MIPRFAGFANLRWGSSEIRFWEDKTESTLGIVSELRDLVSVSARNSGNSDISPLPESEIDDHERPSGEPGSRLTGSGSATTVGKAKPSVSKALIVTGFTSAPRGPNPKPKFSYGKGFPND